MYRQEFLRTSIDKHFSHFGKYFINYRYAEGFFQKNLSKWIINLIESGGEEEKIDDDDDQIMLLTQFDDDSKKKKKNNNNNNTKKNIINPQSFVLNNLTPLSYNMIIQQYVDEEFGSDDEKRETFLTIHTQYRVGLMSKDEGIYIYIYIHFNTTLYNFISTQHYIIPFQHNFI